MSDRPKEWRCIESPDGLVHVVEFAFGDGPILYCGQMVQRFLQNLVWTQDVTAAVPTCIDCAAWWIP